MVYSILLILLCIGNGCHLRLSLRLSSLVRETSYATDLVHECLIVLRARLGTCYYLSSYWTKCSRAHTLIVSLSHSSSNSLGVMQVRYLNLLIVASSWIVVLTISCAISYLISKLLRIESNQMRVVSIYILPSLSIWCILGRVLLRRIGSRLSSSYRTWWNIRSVARVV